MQHNVLYVTVVTSKNDPAMRRHGGAARSRRSVEPSAMLVGERMSARAEDEDARCSARMVMDTAFESGYIFLRERVGPQQLRI